MINDSVREDLKNKISPATKIINAEREGKFSMATDTNHAAKIAGSPKSVLAKTETSETNSPPTTPTLVEFHSKNSTIPEWRLQLQNTVRQRQDRSVAENGKRFLPPVQKTKLVMSGATALKAQPIEKTEELEIAQVKNPTLSSALQRIKNSRQKFLVDEEEETNAALAAVSETPKPAKNYPFHIAGKTSDVAPKNAPAAASPNISVKPTIAVSRKTENEILDPGIMSAIPKPTQISTGFEKGAIIFKDEKSVVESKNFEEKIEVAEKAKPAVKIGGEAIRAEPKAIETEEAEPEEIDDCAPFAMRFNAGLFDLIIGSFASLLLLSPFILAGGNWLSLAGVAAFLATCALVMFVYMTTAIGKYGKTFGMRLFSLEVIDIEDEQYPTLHQAAVSSALFLVSLAFGGIGFLTILFNEDKRAVHDLVSGTVVVKEF